MADVVKEKCPVEGCSGTVEAVVARPAAGFTVQPVQWSDDLALIACDSCNTPNATLADLWDQKHQ